jgi:hypothetical protein
MSYPHPRLAAPLPLHRQAFHKVILEDAIHSDHEILRILSAHRDPKFAHVQYLNVNLLFRPVAPLIGTGPSADTLQRYFNARISGLSLFSLADSIALLPAATQAHPFLTNPTSSNASDSFQLSTSDWLVAP